ncbi:uncharacterized oxidoreductase SSP0419-like [Uranotaenia lowii]|uniref:uncharacterized oxidoreductase SSP0419-like n=1 Tax=Uranotaenia lowii TaxID=190385 RepID=UPI0024784674|nr:uncharacterized oxidoreductase SSP0419-like [Uranotaenia lowii]
MDQAYLKPEDGGYVAASSDFGPPINRARIVLMITLRIFLMIPALVGDLFRELIWCPRKSVRGQVVLVTGGGNGLGRGICERLAREGCKVAVADIDFVGAKRTAKKIQNEGAEAEAFKVDVSDFQSIVGLRKEIEQKFGPVDILVNNAALLGVANCSDGTEEDVQRIIDVNLTSHFWTIRVFKPGMIERKRGHIVAISSVFGLVATFRGTIYTATKFGVRGLMRSLHEELDFLGQSHQVQTTCAYPSFMATRKELVEILKGHFGISVNPITPEHAANIVVDGMLRNDSEIMVGRVMDCWLIRIMQFLPRRIYRLVMKSIMRDVDINGKQLA